MLSGNKANYHRRFFFYFRDRSGNHPYWRAFLDTRFDRTPVSENTAIPQLSWIQPSLFFSISLDRSRKSWILTKGVPWQLIWPNCNLVPLRNPRLYEIPYVILLPHTPQKLKRKRVWEGWFRLRSAPIFGGCGGNHIWYLVFSLNFWGVLGETNYIWYLV